MQVEWSVKAENIFWSYVPLMKLVLSGFYYYARLNADNAPLMTS